MSEEAYQKVMALRLAEQQRAQPRGVHATAGRYAITATAAPLKSWPVAEPGDYALTGTSTAPGPPKKQEPDERQGEI